jgi:hypothetical protein
MANNQSVDASSVCYPTNAPQSQSAQSAQQQGQDITSILEEGAREAYSRPWFRLERGLRLNRLRLYVNENFIHKGLQPDDVEHVVAYLTRALDKKLLNTAKIVDYDTARQRISSIKGFEVRRQTDGSIRCGFLKKKAETAKAAHGKTGGTRRAKSSESQSQPQSQQPQQPQLYEI